jgi:hypothetical protein
VVTSRTGATTTPDHRSPPGRTGPRAPPEHAGPGPDEAARRCIQPPTHPPPPGPPQRSRTAPRCPGTPAGRCRGSGPLPVDLDLSAIAPRRHSPQGQ